MLQLLPIELYWSILNYLEYQDLTILLSILPLKRHTKHFIKRHFPFHYSVSSLLASFESLSSLERQRHNAQFAMQALQFICDQVQDLPVTERKATFNDLLAILQQLTVERILSHDLPTDAEHDYARFSLEVRSRYLHTASIRVLHDPRYRRRSTKYPLAPFLPRSFTWIWRMHCSQGVDENQLIRTRFASYFGQLFEVTSLYLESNLDGTFEECVREALVSGNAQDLLVLCLAAGRPVEVEEMCMMVYEAGEQFRAYLDTMQTDPTPQQELRMQHDNELRQQRLLQRQQEQEQVGGNDVVDEIEEDMIPDWLIPDRYKVHKDTVLRLKLMNDLFNKGWRWFTVPKSSHPHLVNSV
ncbi:hypothetical protein G6F70_005734 [Rhizopus microsporus]|uniref:F-box domain-containing protein n=1 Tax=Rhizopus microsporus TaxID=58291 RepID=A0A0A1MUN6_RHIZD|nr:hypothetical protein G6F70_005734 [Rhizopus microsporus]KAG1206475.1 hypothetical protein G6F69_008807 [Rhizopus microsporus]ORE21875.1 hypothetical protein BCV71DRAFT_224888 [Rhizopus microsporus]CEI90667.1 hypothetical protein RMCBS344292_04985 [Rhizopus microsporus]